MRFSVIAFVLFGCVSSAHRDDAALRAVVSELVTQGGELVVVDSPIRYTQAPFFFHEVVGRPGPVDAALLENLRRRMAGTGMLPKLDSFAEQLSKTEIRRRWPDSVKNCQRVYVSLSFPAYSADGATAVALVSTKLQGCMGGGGYIAVLERRGDGWRVARHVDEFVE